jgi:hypothetical protein
VFPVEGDHLWTPVRWKDRTDIAKLKGQKLQAHFFLNKAEIFGYRITKETGTR